jgi:hypothetical protein
MARNRRSWLTKLAGESNCWDAGAKAGLQMGETAGEKDWQLSLSAEKVSRWNWPEICATSGSLSRRPRSWIVGEEGSQEEEGPFASAMKLT